MTKHMTGTREEWLAARLGLFKEEKELTSPSHYLFLLITKEMTRSPFPQPASDVGGLITDDRARDSGFGTKESRSHLGIGSGG